MSVTVALCRHSFFLLNPVCGHARARARVCVLVTGDWWGEIIFTKKHATHLLLITTGSI